MNWGKGIALVLAVFVFGMLFLVYKTTSVDFELVADDYYAKELAYQGQIDKMKNVRALGADVAIQVMKDAFELQFPMEQLDGPVEGSVVFFRPSGGEFDQQFDLQLDAEGAMHIPAVEWPLGIYNVQIEWNSGGTEFYSEETIYL